MAFVEPSNMQLLLQHIDDEIIKKCYDNSVLNFEAIKYAHCSFCRDAKNSGLYF
jgi:hypothetical protein